MASVRERADQELDAASTTRGIVGHWRAVRRAYFWYGILEGITEASVFRARMWDRLMEYLGHDLTVLAQIDRTRPAEVAHLGASATAVDESIMAADIVQQYLLIKHWEDDQNRYHAETMFPAMEAARLAFDSWRSRHLAELADLKSRTALAGALWAGHGIVPLAAVTRMAQALPASELVAMVGGKAYGLARLELLGVPILPTYVVVVGATVTHAHLTKLPQGVKWAVRSSATVEDGAHASYAGLFLTERDVTPDELPISIERVKASAHSNRVAAYAQDYDGHLPYMAVVLEPYQRAQYAGVWLGSRDRSAGTLSWWEGPGDDIVSGRVTPHLEYWTAGSEPEGALHIGDQPIGSACLALEQAAGEPLDLEWIAGPGPIVYLQLRPVTADVPMPPPPSEVPEGTLKGLASSAGRVTGVTVRLHEPDGPDWTPGSILVIDFATPDWVERIRESKAVIATEGGPTSHAAIIARELGIPCITGLAQAAALPSGAVVTVDGSLGTVTIEDE
jgi:pyruvate,water dikinase